LNWQKNPTAFLAWICLIPISGSASLLVGDPSADEDKSDDDHPEVVI